MTFLAKFFPMGKTNALRGRISNFQQITMETIPEAWERLYDYIQASPHHEIENWLVLQNFYDGLMPVSRATSMLLLEAPSFPSPLMEPWLSLIKWCRIKAEAGKENTKQNAYHEGDGYAFHKNRSFDEKTRGMSPG